MKKLIFVLALILFGAGLYAQNSAYTKEIYKDYGTFKLETDDGHVVSMGAFTTIEEELNTVHVPLETGGKRSLKNKKLEMMPVFEYHYNLYLVSKSMFEGDTTNTWVSGLRIYVDEEDILENQFPDGMTLSIGTEPTLIYTHHCENEFCEFEVTWERAIYEPRIRK
jgi:hypothetical protein